MHSQGAGTIVLFGGPSAERRVSVASAQNLTQYLPGAVFWHWGEDGSINEVSPSELLAHARPFETDFVPAPGRRWPELPQALAGAAGRVVFLAVHGGRGEDGTLQAALEQAGVPFTGSGSAASRLAMNKGAAKARVAQHGVRVAAGVEVGAGQLSPQRLEELYRMHGPLVVKPLAEGSSVGLGFVRGPDDVVRVAAEQSPHTALLVEQLLIGRELTVGVVEGLPGPARALPCSEVRVERGRSFDFAGKYLGAGTVEITPAEVPTDVFVAAQSLALACHRALGCRGYSRTDMIVTETGPVFLETNTLPGLTKASFIPQQLAAAGVPLQEFLEAQLRLARQV